MKWIKFLVPLFMTLGLSYVLNTSSPFGIQDMPALGKLMSPFEGFWQNAKAESKSDYKNQKLKGLKANVEVVYDERLVPHLFASSLEDALFAQGYVTAQHRLWQMDIATRAAAGQLSEVLGARTLEYDRLQRRRGMLLAAERAVESWKESEDYYLLEAYVAGVNAYIQQLSPKDYPTEYKLMGFQPSAWSVLRSALFLKNMAQTLNFRYEDLEATNSLAVFGNATFNFLFPELNQKLSPVIPVGTSFKTDSISQSKLNDTIPLPIGQHLPYPALPRSEISIGSNNWAVSGTKTASGKPILCNDPHLNLTLPSIWYEIQLHTPEFNAYGVSLPGIPGVIIGFNNDVAWGVTNVGQDVTDWYTLEWIDEAKTVYRYDDEARKVEIREEIINIKGAKPVVEQVKYAHYGPIVYESADSKYKDLAMRWLSLEKLGKEEWKTFLLLNAAKNYDDYSAALAYYDIPAQNFVFASKSGDIALKVNGKFPIKQLGQGRFVQDGSKSENEWQGFIPKDEVPQVKNPLRGFVASANQRSTDATYPYYYNSESFDNYRGRYINRELERMNGITVQDMMALQTSSYSLFAEEALPLMLQLLDTSQLNTIDQGLVKLLKDWNYRFDKELSAPVLFLEWSDQIYQLLWDELWVYQDSVEILQPSNWRTVEMMNEHLLNVFWDIKATEKTETPQMVVTQAFFKMKETLGEKLEDKSYTWQQHRGTYIAHLSGSIKPFGRYDIPTNGFRLAPNAVSKTAGPSWRMVVELGDEPRGYGVYPGGQSGTPSSPFYDNMIDTWVKNEYFELYFMKDAQDNRKPILYKQTFKN